MEIHEFSPASDHSILLGVSSNRYELVLKIARRAKQLKDELNRAGSDTMKPVPMAITEMLTDGPEDIHG